MADLRDLERLDRQAKIKAQRSAINMLKDIMDSKAKYLETGNPDYLEVYQTTKENLLTAISLTE